MMMLTFYGHEVSKKIVFLKSRQSLGGRSDFVMTNAINNGEVWRNLGRFGEFFWAAGLS